MNNSSPHSASRLTRLPESIEKILVPIDFSPASNNAFAYAIDLADHLGAQIILVHISSPGVDGGITEEIENFLSSFEPYQNMRDSLDVRPILEIGEPSATLVQLTQSLSIDMVVMGTQGAAGHDQKPLGSVAATVMAQSFCPVLAIPAEASYQPISQMVYALSLSESDQRVVDFLIDLGVQLEARLTCAHININHNGWDAIEIQNFRNAYLRDREIPISFIQAEDEEVVHGLQQIVSQEKADLLVMNTRDRNLWERFFDPSYTRTMLLYADLPVLALQT